MTTDSDTSADNLSRIYSEIEKAQRLYRFAKPWDLYALLGDAYADIGDAEMERVCRWLVSHKQRPFMKEGGSAYWSKRGHATSTVVSGLPAHLYDVAFAGYQSPRDEKAFLSIRAAIEALCGVVG